MTASTALPSVDLDTIKDDVGMPLTGTENDAWLDRRVTGILARFEKYTSRHLGPPVEFKDAWSPARPEQLVRAYWPNNPCPVLYLRNFPVLSLVSVTSGGETVDPASALYEASSGQLIGYGEPTAPNRFVSPVIEYVAGYTVFPSDLYEALVGVVSALWLTRANQQAGLSIGGMTPSKVNIADVGDMGLTPLAGFKDSAASDPYIGPYTYLLDGYTDLRAGLGSVLMPVTTAATP
jgi:hypothetical protein